MNFFKRIKLSFLSVVFFILIPVTIIISAGMAILNYNQSYNNILDGLNNKLLSISSVTASFIDGDEHLVLSKAKEMKAFTFDSKNNILYGVDLSNNLYIIDRELGAAKLVVNTKLNSYNILDITISNKDNIIYVATNHKIISLDLNSKEIREVQSFDFKISGLAYDSKNSIFYIATSHKLYKAYNSKIELVDTFQFNLDSLTFLDNSIYGVNRELNKVFNINLESKVLTYISIKNIEDLSISILALDYQNLYMGDKHLIIYNRDTQELLHEDFARLYRDESLVIYKRYIEPMTEIKLALNLTYHYTFNLLYGDEENNCYYIFDVHEGNEYSPIGSYDVMDYDDLIGAEAVILRDTPYVSDIKLWEKWGLLKVAYAGIKDSNGKVVALAGTDIDITIIKSKTHEAIIHSISIGIIAMIISILASYYIAKKLTKPIYKLKNSALKIAAGRYNEKVYIESPLELSILSKEFNDMAKQLTDEIDNFNLYSQEVRSKKLNKRLNEELLKMTIVENSEDIQIDRLEYSTIPSGVIYHNKKYYVWESKNISKTFLHSIEESAIMAKVLKKILILGEDLSIFKEIFNLEYFSTIDIENRVTIDNIDYDRVTFSRNTIVNRATLSIKLKQSI